MPFSTEFAWLFRQDATIAAAVFVIVVAAMAAAMLASRRRRRRNLPPSRTSEANRLELGYVLGLGAVAVFLIYSSITANARDFAHPPRPALTVRVTAAQWCWRFSYPSGRTVTGQCQGGRPPTMVIPAGEPVRIELTSADVVHAYWIPYFRLKMYAYPGETNDFTFTAPHPGRWAGRCAQLCGLYHYTMDFVVQAVPAAAFNASGLNR